MTKTSFKITTTRNFAVTKHPSFKMRNIKFQDETSPIYKTTKTQCCNKIKCSSFKVASISKFQYDIVLQLKDENFARS